MTYRTILVHVDHTGAAETRIRLAARLALREDAHLVGTAMSGVPRFMYAGDPFDASGAIIADYVELADKRASAALDRFDAIARGMGLSAAERRNLRDDEFAGLCLQARYADLVILGQAMPAGQGSLLQDLAPHVVLHSGKPVLTVPREGDFPTLGERPLIAWDGSLEAAHAVAAAIPLLRSSNKVTLAVFGAEPGYDAHGEEPGADIALYLARHGVKVEVLRQPDAVEIGKAILALAAAVGADLLVMGAYGHSRLREMVVGGATRTVFESMTLPVLMAH